MSLASLMPAPNSVIKGVKKYLQQALRLDKVEPLVAYYCRMYAMQQAIAVKSGKTKEDMKLLGGLMTWLEAQKHLKAVPKEEAQMKCQAFALNVFAHADNEDRKGPADAAAWKQVALSFHATYVFMDVCKQFGDLDAEFLGRCKYAKWKTADIFKALADNRLPKPGSLSEQQGGGAGGGLEDELAALSREDDDGPAAAAAAAPKTKPAVASPASAPAAATPATASDANAQVPNFGVPKPSSQSQVPNFGAPKPSPQVPAPASAPAAAAAAKAAPVPQPASAPSYPTFEASSYVPLDDAHAPAPVVVVPQVAATNGGGGFNPAYAPAAAAAPAATPMQYAYPPATASVGGLNLPKGSLVVVPKASGDVGDAVHECEKLMRHAQSALNFEDCDTAVAKLKDALALLLPHRKKL